MLGIPLAASRTFRKCQLNCGFCFVERERRGTFLGLRDHLRVIDEFGELGGRYVRTATVGEPFLDRVFFNPEGRARSADPEESRYPLIDHANRRGLFWTSFTNMLNVTEQIAEELSERDVSIIGKLHAMDPNIQESMTGNTGHYAARDWAMIGARRIPKQLKLLIDAGFAQPRSGDAPTTTRLAVDIVATKVNFRHIPEVVVFCLDNNIYPFLEMLEIFGDANRNGHKFNMDEVDQAWLCEQLVTLLGTEFFGKEARSRTNRLCPAFSAGLTYNPDGSVRYCYCANASLPWNVKLHDLRQIFSGLDLERGEILSRLEAISERTSQCAPLDSCPMGAYGKGITRSGGHTVRQTNHAFAQ